MHLLFQLGVLHDPWLRAQYHPRASSLSVDDMGPYWRPAFTLLPPTGTLQPWTEWQLGQIYSFTRICALVMVILNLIYINTKTPINCEVGGISHVRVITATI
jgi:hypothetical protein